VAHSDLKPAAEGGVLLDGAEALAHVGEEAGMAREQQIGVGLVLVTADAAAQLIEIAQAEAVGAINDDGVGVGDVQATLDDRSGKQHIGFAIDELGHDLFEIVTVHLAVADNDAGARQERAKLMGNRFNGQDAVVQEEDLATAVKLALNGVANDPLVVLRDDG